jgi:hypothetical protein
MIQLPFYIYSKMKTINPEKTQFATSLAKWASILGATIIFGWTAATYHLSLWQRIEEISIESKKQHEQVMAKLLEIDARQQVLISRNQLVEVMIYQRRDLSSNQLSLDDELKYRAKLLEMLQRR